MSRWTLTIPGDPPTMNQLIGQHWSRVHKQRGRWREGGYYAALEARVPRGLDRIRVTFQAIRPAGRLPDPDAISLVGKWILDGLVDARVVRDDCGAHVAWVRHLAPARDGGPAIRVVIEIEQAQEASGDNGDDSRDTSR